MVDADEETRAVSSTSTPRIATLHPMTALVEPGFSTRWLLRLIPNTRGNWLVGTRLFRGLRRARLVRLSLRHGDFHTDLRLDLADPAQFTMVRRGRFDVMTAAIVHSALRSGDTFLDVGANWGYFTSIAARRVGLDGLVLAIEPNRTAYRRLVDTLGRERLVNVVATPWAAYDRVGLQVSLVRSRFHQTTSSYVRESQTGGQRSVLTSTVDYLTSKIASRSVRLLKVDTEGAELPVVRGAERLLTESKPLVVLEVSRYSARFGYTIDQLYDYMAAMGYSCAYFINDTPGQWKLSGPLTTVVEGQILFRHPDGDCPLPLDQS